ncbi:hypothetical protein SBY92_005245 [Candida maltosa Xu316]
MPKVSNIDKFIELSTDLLTYYPTTTTLSITYTNVAKKQSSKKSSSTDNKTISKPAKSTHSVNFKLYEPHSGKCIKYNTSKSKELSRLLNFIGPKGVSNDNLHVLGLASLMANVKYDIEPNVETTPAPEPEVVDKGKDNEKEKVDAPASGSSKKKNKKKKKKN